MASFDNPGIAGNPFITLVAPEHGGHCALISCNDGDERFWAESRAIEFCTRMSRMYGKAIMSLDNNTIPQVLYNTDDPQSNPAAELYSINATILPTATDPVKRWVMEEVHGWWDESTKQFLNKATTFLPNEPSYAVSIDMVFSQIQAQIMMRVNQGFKFQLEWNPMAPNHFSKYEWSLDGTRKRYK